MPESPIPRWVLEPLSNWAVVQEFSQHAELLRRMIAHQVVRLYSCTAQVLASGSLNNAKRDPGAPSGPSCWT